jgi:hypothetical protein
MWHVWWRRVIHTGFRWGNVKERDNFEDLDVDGRVMVIGLGRVRWINLA